LLGVESLESREVLSASNLAIGSWPEEFQKKAVELIDSLSSSSPVPVDSSSGQALSILGNDDRRLVKDMMDQPYASIGTVISRFGNQLSAATGTMIGRNTVLTVAHAVYNWPDADSPYVGMANEVYFLPAISGTDIGASNKGPFFTSEKMPFGSARAIEILVNPEYMAAQSFGEDYAVLRLDRNYGDYTGTMEVIPDPGNSFFLNNNLHTVGYPFDLNPYSTNPYEQAFRVTQFSGNELGSTTMDVAAGQSGSPMFFTQGRLRPAVVGMVVAAGEKVNGGVRLDADAFQKIQGWLAKDGQVTDLPDITSFSDSIALNYDYQQITFDGDGSIFQTAAFANIRNLGTAPTGRFQVGFQNSRGISLGTVLVESIEPFRTTQIALAYSPPVDSSNVDAEGIRMFLDPSNQVREYEEDDNFSIGIRSFAGPPLEESLVSNTPRKFPTNPDKSEYSVAAGGTLTIDAAYGLTGGEFSALFQGPLYSQDSRTLPKGLNITTAKGITKGSFTYSPDPDKLSGGVYQSLFYSIYHAPYLNRKAGDVWYGVMTLHVGKPSDYDVRPLPLPYRLGSYAGGGWTWDSSNNFKADVADEVFTFGVAGDLPVIGDWNGDGTDDMGVVRGGAWYLDSNNTLGWQGNDTSLTFGGGGDRPVAGDWNGDKRDDVGVFREGMWFLDSNGSPGWQGNDSTVSFGVATDKLVVGDWDGDGKDDIGVVRGDVWYLDTNKIRGWQGNDTAVRFGAIGDTPVVGDWNQDGRDDLGVYRNGMWFLDSNGTLGWQSNDRSIRYNVGNTTPIAGMGKNLPRLQAAGNNSIEGTWQGTFAWPDGNWSPWSGLFSITMNVRPMSASDPNRFQGTIFLTSSKGSWMEIIFENLPSPSSNSSGTTTLDRVNWSSSIGTNFPRTFNSRWEDGLLKLDFLDGSEAQLSRV
jgi:V8-like Glu-specific endopeptidase